jgi:hypothetical protein
MRKVRRGFDLLLSFLFLATIRGVLLTATHAETRTAADLTPEAVWEAIDAAQACYIFDGDINGDRNSRQDTTMNMVLRPHESLTEKPKFAIEKGPKWLKIDADTGVLSGTPDAPGKVEVVVTATIDREARKLDEERLKWGGEKVVSQQTERVGSASQPFMIEVGP